MFFTLFDFARQTSIEEKRLTYTTLSVWVNSVDDKLIIIFRFSLENRLTFSGGKSKLYFKIIEKLTQQIYPAC